MTGIKRVRPQEQPKLSRLQIGYVAAIPGFLFISAWAASDSFLHALLAVGFFLGLLLAVVLHNLRVQKQRFIKIADSEIDGDRLTNDSSSIRVPR